ncbi:hypothetical protein L228DRAFT_279274 [Xylona heveae TC161]|uniref:Telomere length regulation protein conserved domain-containing protein n=1 Tax=Xylona heveae (strain CBS 132557 / TC161) TaxID=1328760 RepID=A0A165JBQ2_XYLHT|nr:hypothetical protein L228DRAFT_279274 [Xylona heveae TC161]KZF26020.1 hypothetical protein L228DRAFT_279274 [Xylona heveae TC161]
MEDLLMPVQTTLKISEIEADEAKESPRTEVSQSVSSAQEALELLRSQPSQSALTQVLTFLDPKSSHGDGFNIKAPTALSSQLINVLVASIIPDFWPLLEQDLHRQRDALLRCLRSISALGAICAQLRLLITASKTEGQKADRRDVPQRLSNLLAVLMHLLGDESLTLDIWTNVNTVGKGSAQKSVLWREHVSVVATSRLVSTAAEAEDIIRKSEQEPTPARWICSGSKYAQWLGWNIRNMAENLALDDVEGWRSLSGLLGKSLSLGFTEDLLLQLCPGLLSKDEKSSSPRFQTLISHLPQHQQRNILYTLCRIISRSIPHSAQNSISTSGQEGSKKSISGCAALITEIIAGNSHLCEDVIGYLIGLAGGGAGEPVGIRRVLISALSSDEDAMQTLLDKSMQQFGDKLYIKHTPTLYQDALAQVVLLVAGYIHRSNPMHLFTMARSSIHINSISNRLAASSLRARFLGMVVGVSISELVDKPDKQMKFGTEELETDEAKWYKNLVHVDDKIGTLDDLKSTLHPLVTSSAPNFITSATTTARPEDSKPASDEKPKPPKPSRKAPASKPEPKKSPGIIEVLDSSSSSEPEDEDDDEDDDLIPYAKPDSDAEDSDDDPTLVTRKKPSAPVYIRDLISGLRDVDNYDRQRISLSSASALIRRKAGFGTELSEHCEELASLLIGLSDKFSIDHFQEWRLQAMIALLVSQPLQMGQWFSRTFFQGDYSIGQRISILTTLGMGAREIAGYKSEDAQLTQSLDVNLNAPPPHPPHSQSHSQSHHTSPPNPSDAPFPSKYLPHKLHSLYSSSSTSSPVNALTDRLQQSMIQPMAATAADSLSRPNALKVRTFSSRMQVEKRRGKPVANELAKIVAAGFFLPLTGLWWAQLNAYSSSTSLSFLSGVGGGVGRGGGRGSSNISNSNSNNIYLSPLLLPYFLKTLALILHASGPSNPALPQMTSEFWDLLLSLRSKSLLISSASASPSPSPSLSEDPLDSSAGSIAVLESLLFAFLTLLDINAESESNARRLAEEQSRELLETQEWAEHVFEVTRGGDEEGDKVRMLAASVLLRTREVVERYQRLLMGEMVDF